MHCRLTRLLAILACGILGFTTANCVSNSTGTLSNAAASLRPSQTLKDAPALEERKIGTALNGRAFKTDAQYRALVAREFNMITPENAMKMEKTNPRLGVFDFSEADAMAAFAKKNRMQMRGHCLAWHHALPKWLTRAHYSPEQLQEILESFISTSVLHFKEKFPEVVQSWDVVNEAFGDDGEFREESIWGQIGEKPHDYIEAAFRSAYNADPEALLFYNDYGAEEINAKSDAIFKLLRMLKYKGIPVHGIGFQMHLAGEGPHDFASMAKNFARFRDIGLVIHITEFNNRMEFSGSKRRASGELTIDQLTAQSKNFAAVAKLCLQEPACKAMVTWNFSDKYEWVAPEHKGWGAQSLFDKNLKPKPGYFAFLDALTGP